MISRDAAAALAFLSAFVAFVAFVAACSAGSPRVPPDSQPVAAFPAAPVPVSSASAPAPPSASAPPPASASSDALRPPPASSAPAAPPLTAVTGAAAIVWVPDEKAASGIRSEWIEPNGDQATVVAQKSGMVFVGRKELWALGSRDVRLTTAKCNDPNTQCNPHPELQEPYLKSLGTGKAAAAPWGHELRSASGCDKTVDVTIDGAVGTVVFARIWTTEVACGSTCPMHGESLTTFDVDTGKIVSVGFPREILSSLRERNKIEAPPGLPDFCGPPAEYRATGAYTEGGELEGIYEFGDSHSGLCGSAVHCPNPVQRAAWVPAELAPWGKLPAWVADHLARTKAHYAFVVPAARADAAKKEFSR